MTRSILYGVRPRIRKDGRFYPVSSGDASYFSLYLPVTESDVWIYEATYLTSHLYHPISQRNESIMLIHRCAKVVLLEKKKERKTEKKKKNQ